MAETTQTNLRQAKAKAFSLGILSEMVLEEKKNEEGKEMIEGYLTIKTSDVNFVRYKASAFKLTKDGKENSVYKGLQTCKNEYKTIKDFGEAEATRVKVSGEINAYTGQRGDVVGFKSNFFNRVNGPLANEDMVSEFEVEVYIKAIVPEVDKEGLETGALIVHGWMPTYTGIEPIALKVPEDLAGDVQSLYEPGQTVCFNGEIINNRIEHIKEIPMAIGKPKIEKTYEYKNDMVITGSTPAYGEEADGTLPAAYASDAIQLALNERETKLAEKRTRTAGTQSSNSKPSGATRGRGLNF